MNKEKNALLIVSPLYPPQEGGLSDYTYKLYMEVRKIAPARVLTSLGQSKDPNVLMSIRNWKLGGFYRLFKTIRQAPEEKVLIQYVPYMYNPRGGINFSFPLCILLLKLVTKKQFFLMVHEFGYPYLGNLKTLILFICHEVMGRFLIFSSKKIFFSTDIIGNIIQSRTKKQTFKLVVGSNIEKVQFNESDWQNLKEKLQVKQDKFAIVFGGFHPTKKLEETHRYCADNDIYLIHMGIDKEAAGQFLKEDLLERENVLFTGYLKEREISMLLSKATLLLAFFEEGATTRRGTLMAGIEHNVMTLTTKSKHTDQELFDCPNLLFCRPELQEFEKLLKENWNKESSAVVKGNPFSWDKIAKDLASYLQL